MKADEIRDQLARKGIDITPEEAEKMVAGMARSQRLTSQLREEFAPEDEPSTVFAPARPKP